MGILRRMGRQGDIPTQWEIDDEGSVREAQKHFDEMIGKGGLAFKFDKDGGEGEQIDAFDPNAKEIIVTPRIAGGSQ
jgi:hypothetical protein